MDQVDKINMDGQNSNEIDQEGNNQGEEQQLFEQSTEQNKVENGDSGKKDSKLSQKDQKKADQAAKKAEKKKAADEKKAQLAAKNKAKKEKKASKGSDKKAKTPMPKLSPQEDREKSPSPDMKDLNDSKIDIDQRRVTMETNFQTGGRPTEGMQINTSRQSPIQKDTKRKTMQPLQTPATTCLTPLDTPDNRRTVSGKKDMGVLSSELFTAEDVFQNKDSEMSSQTDMNAAEGELQLIYKQDYKLENGQVYTGQMKVCTEDGSSVQFIAHGRGKMILEDGSSWDGEWNFGLASGEGIFNFQNGDIYEGNFDNMMAQGYGELRKTDGTVIKGLWVDNQINEGTEIKNDGTIYTGKFLNSMRHGQGECIMNNKYIFKGTWDNGVIQGQGVYYHPDGTMVEGFEMPVQETFDAYRFSLGATGTINAAPASNTDNQVFGNAKDFEMQEEELAQSATLIKTQHLADIHELEDKSINTNIQDALDANEAELDAIRLEYDVQHSDQAFSCQTQQDLLKEHRDRYNRFYRQYEDDWRNDKWEFNNLKKELQETPIYCQKYNHTLESSVVNHFQFDSKIQISEDGQKVIITNKKPLNNPRYVYEETPEEVTADFALYNQARAQGKGDDFIKSKNKEEEFEWLQSSCTCDVSDIEAILYGGISSRFWVFRKHMIAMEYDTIKMDNQATKCSFPFFAWQCITLQIKGRCVDLVIKDDNAMNLFLRFLVQALNTMDGHQDSAQFFIDAATINEIDRRERKLNKRVLKIRKVTPLADDEEYDDSLELKRLHDYEQRTIKEDMAKEIYRQTMFKYLLMRVRSKIAYHAFQKRMTINELIISQIYSSYKTLTRSGSIQPIAPYSKRLMRDFDQLLDSPNALSLNSLLELARDPCVQKRKGDIYKRKELARLGVSSMSELPREGQAELRGLFEKNIGIHYKQSIEEASEMQRSRFSQQSAKIKSMGKPIQSSVFDCTQCSDIYQNTVIDGMSLYEQRSRRVMVRYKYDKINIQTKLDKCKFMLGIGDLHDVFYMKTVLKKKALQKQAFVLEMEHEQEVYIPDDLSCEMYPKSFRYYDPIIQITNQLFSVKQKLYHCLKTDFYLQKLKGNDFQKLFLEKAGILTTEKTKTASFKHQLMDAKEEKELKHTQAKDSIGLQTSRYLMVESTEEGLYKLSQLQTYILEKKIEKNVKKKKKNLEDTPLELKYCKQADVNRKRQKFIVFKQCQYQRHDHLKNQGQKFHTMRCLQQFIGKNIDHLYTHRPREIVYNEKLPENLRNLDLRPFHSLTNREKNILEADKRCYGEYLMTISEEKVTARRFNMRQKLIAEIYKECNPSVAYEKRNNYVEQRLEERFRYFDNMDDLNGTAASNIMLMKQLSKLTKQLKSVAKQGRVDKVGILSSQTDNETFINRKSSRALKDSDEKIYQDNRLYQLDEINSLEHSSSD